MRKKIRTTLAVLFAVSLFALEAPAQEEPLPAEEQLAFADGLFARGLYDMALAEYRRVREDGGDIAGDLLLLRIGECHRRLGDKVAAEEAYRGIMERFPESPLRPRAELRRAELFVAAGRFEEAVNLFDALLEQAPPEDIAAAATYFRAYSSERAGAGKAALEGYRQVIEGHPDSPYSAYAALAAAGLLDQAGRPREAARFLEQAAASPPSPRVAAEALFLLGDLAYREARYADAALAFNRILDEYPGDRRAAEAQLKSAWALARSGQCAEALERVAGALAEPGTGSRGEWVYLQGHCLRELGRLEEAARSLDAFPADAADDAMRSAVAFERVLVAYGMGDYEKVLAGGRDLEPATEMGAELDWMLADAASRLGRSEQAETFFARLVERYPDSPRAPVALFRRGRIAEEGGQTNKGVALYRELAERHADHALAPEALYAAGVLNAQSGASAEAAADWRALAEAYPAFPQRAEALYQLGLAEMRREDTPGAATVFTDLLESYPEGERAPEARFWLGVLHEEGGDLARAEDQLRRAAADADDEAFRRRALYRLAGVVQKRGDEAGAADLLQGLLGTPTAREMPPSLLEWLARRRAQELPAAHEAALAAATALADSDGEPYHRQLGAFLSGEAHRAAGRTDAARAAYERACGIGPPTRARAEAALRLGALALERDEATDAEKWYGAAARDASEVDLPDLRAGSYMGLAAAASASGDRDEALRRYLSVGILFDDPDVTPEALYRAVRLLEELGREDERRRTAGELRERYPDSAWTAELDESAPRTER